MRSMHLRWNALVADGEHLVDEEQVGIGVDRDGERKADDTSPTSRT